MFTGIVKEIGIIKEKRMQSFGIEFVVDCPKLASMFEVDDSVAVNGVCQTVTRKSSSLIAFQTIPTTIEKTNLGQLKVGDQVNLEPTLRFGSGIEGHLVQGHVNTTAKVVSIQKTSEIIKLWIEIPRGFEQYFVNEGSISIDGTSLTISDLNDLSSILACSIIPHTWENTVMKNYRIGTIVNIEVDILAKYIERMMKVNSKKALNLNTLMEQGF